MRLESDPQGNPVGVPIADFNLSQLPESKSVLPGRLCRLEPLEADKHAADLFEAFSLDKTNSLFTYMAHGPFQTAGAERD
jgi:hypothetical protein